MCPACLGSTLLLLSSATSTGGLAAFIAGKACHRSQRGPAIQPRGRKQLLKAAAAAK
jgi:hypothetical protein